MFVLAAGNVYIGRTLRVHLEICQLWRVAFASVKLPTVLGEFSEDWDGVGVRKFLHSPACASGHPVCLIPRVYSLICDAPDSWLRSSI